jgi:uncharacterized SAM-dependent methyltransferase
MERYLGNDWVTKKEIIEKAYNDGIKLHERVWRKFVEDYNKQYWRHEVDTFIVHSSKGYKLTSDKEEIKASIQDGKKRALNLLWKYSQTRKALGEVDNIKFDLEEMGIV